LDLEGDEGKEKCFGIEVGHKNHLNVRSSKLPLCSWLRAERGVHLARGKYLLINMHFKSKTQATALISK